jgi:hypothetical protein
MPTASDLVTDLPADFEVFGQAVDTSLADLKGGTTGQVLSKASNTNMDFTWVTTDDANAIQNTIVDAKGDLISATGSDVPARLAVGNNGETLVADSSTSTGLRYTAGNPIPNPTLNAAMQLWQRGTSFTITTPVYTADRWQAGRGSNVAGSTVTRQVTNDTTNLPSIQYSLRFQRDSGNTATNPLYLAQSFESVNSIPFAGKTVTLSFYARAGANYSAVSNVLAARLLSGTGTDQNLLTAGYTGSTTVIGQNATLTTTWQRFTFTASIASTATEIGLFFESNPSGTAGANDWFEITGLQIDIGSVALPFRTNGATIQGELAACQRYYFRAVSGAAYGQFGGNPAYSASLASPAIPFPVTMRVPPTSVETSGVGTFICENNSSTSTSGFTTIALNTGVTTSQYGVLDISKTSSFTTGIFYKLIANNSTTAYVGFSAEL